MMVLNNVTKDLSSLKVKDLKALSREKGLKLEHKGHKFTKQELINNLVEFYKNEEKEGEEEKADVVEAIEAVAEVVEETQAQNDEEAWEEEKEETETKEQEFS